MTTNLAFNKRNAEDFENNTKLITEAIKSISSNSNLKATIAQIAKLTGLHRNTISERDWPKERLVEIKQRRKAKQQKTKQDKASQEEQLNDQIEKMELELVHWFTTAKKLQADLNQLQYTHDIMTQTSHFYQEELKKERQKTQDLQSQNALLSQLIQTKED